MLHLGPSPISIPSWPPWPPPMSPWSMMRLLKCRCYRRSFKEGWIRKIYGGRLNRGQAGRLEGCRPGQPTSRQAGDYREE